MAAPTPATGSRRPRPSGPSRSCATRMPSRRSTARARPSRPGSGRCSIRPGCPTSSPDIPRCSGSCSPTPCPASTATGRRPIMSCTTTSRRACTPAVRCRSRTAANRGSCARHTLRGIPWTGLSRSSAHRSPRPWRLDRMAAELPSVPAVMPPVGLSIVGEPAAPPRRRLPVPAAVQAHIPAPISLPTAPQPAPVERSEADLLDGSAVRSVDRAAALLLALGDFPTEAGVTELARKLGLHKSTASRLLATLQRRGLVEQDEESGKYRLGLIVIRLAERAEKTLARPELERLARSTRETVGLAVLDGDRCLTVVQVDGPNMVACPDWTGRTTPLHCVASGKVLLATMPERDVMRLAKKGLPSSSERTITTLEGLLEELARVRRRGFATAFSEWEP